MERALTPSPRVPGVRNRLAYAEGELLDERIVPGSVKARHARLAEPHVAELDRWAQEVAAAERRRVPSFDPESGGTGAAVLVPCRTPPRSPPTAPG